MKENGMSLTPVYVGWSSQPRMQQEALVPLQQGLLLLILVVNPIPFHSYIKPIFC